MEIARTLESTLRTGLSGTGASGLRPAALHQNDGDHSTAHHHDPEHDPQPGQVGGIAGGRFQALGTGQVGRVLPRDGVAGDLPCAAGGENFARESHLDLKVGDHACADSLRIAARHVEAPLLAGLVEAEIADIGELGGAGELATDVLVVLVALLFEVAWKFHRAHPTLADCIGILDAARLRFLLQHSVVGFDLDRFPAIHVGFLTHPDAGAEHQDERQDQGDDADSA